MGGGGGVGGGGGAEPEHVLTTQHKNVHIKKKKVKNMAVSFLH